MNILAIDPGNERSAWLVYDGERVIDFGITPNDELRKKTPFGRSVLAIDVAVVEMVASFGMAVGKEVFETMYWIGRFCESLSVYGIPVVERMYRMEVKQHLCHDSRAKDSNIRQALIDRFGPGQQAACGTKAAPGPLYKISKDVWSALAIAVTYADTKISAPV
jgi:hypothetical protein